MRRAWTLLGLLAAACGSKKTAHDDAGPAPAKDATVAIDAPAIDAPPATPARVEHAAWSLVDNRHAAHRFVDGELVIDAADIGFARYIRFGVPVPRWHLGQSVAGVRAAAADRTATLEVPLTVEQARTTVQLTARVFGDAKQQLAVKINGRPASKDPRVELAAGWQTVAFAIDPARFGVGENQIVFETSGKAKGKIAFEWLRFGIARELTDADPRAAITFDAKGSVDLAKDAGLTYFVTVPDGAHLVADVSSPCSIEVRARPSADAFAGGALASFPAMCPITLASVSSNGFNLSKALLRPVT